MGEPSPNGVNGSGRDPLGRFAKGNAGGPGNPFNKRVGEWRATFMRALRPTDLRRIVRATVNAALAGDTAAAGLLLRYALGPPDALHSDAGREALRTDAEQFVTRLFAALERCVPPATLLRAAKEVSDCHAMLIESDGDDDEP